MEREEKALKMPKKQFKRIIGTTKPVFQKMMSLLETTYEKLHETGGKPPDLTVGDKLLVTMQYYREYRTMENIAVDYGCAKSSVCRSINWGRTNAVSRWSISVARQASLARQHAQNSRY